MVQMYRNLNLSVKLIFMLCLVLVVVFGLYGVVNLKTLKKTSIEKAEIEAHSAGKAYAELISTTMHGYESTLVTLSESLKSMRMQSGSSRPAAATLLNNVLEENPNAYGLFMLWEPNAFDGKDTDHVSSLGNGDATGRFNIYVERHGAEIKKDQLINYDKEGSGDYYLLTKQTLKTQYMEPMLYDDGNQKVMKATIVMPMLDDSGKLLGIVGFFLSMDSLQEAAAKYTPMGGYVALITEAGTYLTNPTDPDSIGKTFGDNPEKVLLWEEIVKNKQDTGYTMNSKGKRVMRSFDGIKLPGTDQVWYTQTAVEESRILEDYEKSRLTTIALTIAAMMLLGVVVYILVRQMIVKPVQSLMSKMKEMAEGDLTGQLDIRTNDEIGQMGQAFNAMSVKLRDMFRLVSELATTVGQTSQQLTAGASEASEASRKIAESIQLVADGAQSQSRSSEDTSLAIQEMANGAMRISESSADVSATTEEVAKQTRCGNVKMQQAVGKMDSIHHTADETEKALHQLALKSEDIGSAIQLIADISVQTNLLSLNAAIEASRAGEHGRGFAVVAGEIRKLAEGAKSATTQISTILKEIQTDTKRVESAMKKGIGEIAIGVEAVGEGGQLFRSILQEIERVNGQLQAVSDASQQMTASTEEISATMDYQSDLADSASIESLHVAGAAEQQLASMEQISVAAVSLNGTVQQLLDNLSRFKI
ncbi:methyl-accepting chemotaxis protein [Paenibacillus sp. GSMTC-2017]|uniref:methyl-accepting chemotaxis protein n=1 Tax=Paenibacillus sp. GSMTC-2017 TaxID=2794350 RepID=UPI0018D922E2|nr:methyl-accepting chemotaxis protein [Paenibacillus sp. GSMTC-2017]MBH5316951.1 methyl-accepting chemotaxis protein [Paenibacillus sp. GSMTC-2017]